MEIIMIEKKIRKFFNSVSIPSCRPAVCEEDYLEELPAEDAEEIEVTPEMAEEPSPNVKDYVCFMAKTLAILTTALVVAKTIAFLVSAVSGEDED